jgi:hypothetical protein
MRSDDSYRGQTLIGVALVLLGVGLLAVPGSSEGAVLVPISEGHGLSAVDTVGAGLLAVGGTWLEVLVIRRLPRLGLSPRVLFGLGLVAGVGVGLVVASAFSGFFWWWAVGAAVLGLVILGLVVRMLR